MDFFRRDADARYAEIEATARAIQRATAKLTGRGSGSAPDRPKRCTQAMRQVRGLERALRLERRRDAFQGPGTSRRRWQR